MRTMNIIISKTIIVIVSKKYNSQVNLHPYPKVHFAYSTVVAMTQSAL